MFKTIVLASVAALLSHTASAKWSFGWCSEPTLQANFDASQYQGTWFENARDKGILFEYGECTQARYTLNSDGSLGVHNSLLNGFTGRIDEVKGSASCVGAHCKVGFFLFKTGDYRVLETDYTSYSVVYSCKPWLFFWKTENIWILTRTATIDATLTSTVNAVITSKVPSSEFTNFKYPTQGGSCQYLP